MVSYTCGSGGAVCVPDEIERKTVRVSLDNSNDNAEEEEQS